MQLFTAAVIRGLKDVKTSCVTLIWARLWQESHKRVVGLTKTRQFVSQASRKQFTWHNCLKYRASEPQLWSLQMLWRLLTASTSTVHQLSLPYKPISSWVVKSLALSQCFNSDNVRLCCELMIRVAVVFQQVFHHGNHRGTCRYLWEIATWSSNVEVWVAKWLVRKIPC